MFTTCTDMRFKCEQTGKCKTHWSGPLRIYLKRADIF
jgi:hypothetical protein